MSEKSYVIVPLTMGHLSLYCFYIKLRKLIVYAIM